MPDDLIKKAQERLKRLRGEEEVIEPDLTSPSFWERFNQPANTMGLALRQFGEGKYPTAGMNVLNSILEFGATPFTILDEGLKQGEKFIESNIVKPLGLTNKDLGIGKTPTTSEIISKPFELTAEGVSKGTELIDKSLNELGLDTKKIDENTIKVLQMQGMMPEGDAKQMAKEFSQTGLKLNQILAQFVVGGELLGTAGNVTKGLTNVKSLSPVEGLKATLETKQLKDLNKGKLTFDVAKEQKELQKMLESETPEFLKPSTLENITSQILKSEGKRRKEFDVIAKEERGQRYARLQSALDSKATGSDKVINMLSSQKGKFKQPDFEPIKITQPEIESLVTKVVESPKLDGYEKLQASMVLNEVIGNPKMQTIGGRVPTNRELLLLEKVFGKEFTDAIKSHRGRWENFKEQFKSTAVDVLNIPRAIMASVDMSAPLRQGLVLTVTRPKESIPASVRMVKQFFNDDFFKMMEEKIQNSPNKELYDNAGLEFTKSGRDVLSGKEEAFMTSLAEKLPFGMGSLIRASERAYVGYLNDIRKNVFDNISNDFKKSGLDPKKDIKVFEDLAKFINLSTGRGRVPNRLRELTPALNNVFFSIRNNLAKIQLPYMLIDPKLSPQVRKQTAKTLVGTTGVILSILSLAKLAGAEVESDPRSSDFAKIKIGDTRLDVLGGWQQWIRNTAQIMLDEQKDLSTGKIKGSDEFPFTNRAERLLKFSRSKLSPAAGIGANLLTGKTFLGEDVTLENQIQFFPFAAKDIYEASQEHGMNGVFLGIPAFFGAGLQTFKTKKQPK